MAGAIYEIRKPGETEILGETEEMVPGRLGMVVENVVNAIEKYNLIDKGDKVIVGLSGGPDSVCLLHVLHTVRERLGFRLYALHVNHQLRGAEADADEAYVRELCTRLGIELHVKSIAISEFAAEKGLSLEEAGREVRYREFDALAKALGGARIAVAHNKNDQAETVLMRILRGTGLDGLKGMNHKRESVIRPLLDTERRAIEQYCSDQGLTPRTDRSNLENVYTRNRIRLELIPYIDGLFETDVVESLYRMSSVIKEDCELLEDSVDRALEQCRIEERQAEIVLSTEELEKMKNGMVKRVLRSAVMHVKGDLKGIENHHIERAASLAAKGKTGAVAQLPHGLRAVRSYGTLKIFKEIGEAGMQKYGQELKTPGNTWIKELNACIDVSLIKEVADIKKFAFAETTSLEQFFDYDMLREYENNNSSSLPNRHGIHEGQRNIIGEVVVSPAPAEGIYIRNRREGDTFKPLKSIGTKKLKEYFIDNKIPRDERDKIPLVAKNNEIVWVVGYKISDKFKVTENTKNVVRVKYVPST